jgi:DNA polymerase-4
MELADRVWKPPAPVRLLNVTALSLTDSLETYEQADLFTPQQPVEDEKHERLEQAVDAIRRKYGGGAISYGGASGLGDEVHDGEELLS